MCSTTVPLRSHRVSKSTTCTRCGASAECGRLSGAVRIARCTARCVCGLTTVVVCGAEVPLCMIFKSADPACMQRAALGLEREVRAARKPLLTSRCLLSEHHWVADRQTTCVPSHCVGMRPRVPCTCQNHCFIIKGGATCCGRFRYEAPKIFL